MKKSSIFPLIRYEGTIALFKVLNYFASDKKVNSKIQIKIPGSKVYGIINSKHLHVYSLLSLSLCENVLLIYPLNVLQSTSIFTPPFIPYTFKIQQNVGF